MTQVQYLHTKAKASDSKGTRTNKRMTLYIYTSLHVTYRQKTEKQITRSPDINILESNWKYKSIK